MVRLYQFNSVLFQLVKQGKCFLFRKIRMEFFHRLVIKYAYASELWKQLGESNVIINLAFVNPKHFKRLPKDTVLNEMRFDSVTWPIKKWQEFGVLYIVQIERIPMCSWVKFRLSTAFVKWLLFLFHREERMNIVTLEEQTF